MEKYTLTGKNKKVLEKILNCKLKFQETTGDPNYEFYTINTILSIEYNKKGKYYCISDDYINELNSCNEIVIVQVAFSCLRFVFIDDLKNIDI